MSTTHVSATKAYQSLAHSPVQWMKQTWGDAGCIAFRGTDAEIVRCHTLFANYDLRAPDGWGNAPAAPRLQWAGDTVAYMYMSDERLLASLTLYFDCMLRYHHETGMANPVPQPVDSDIEDEVTPDWEEWIHDEALCAQMAKEAAIHFIEHHITTRCFMPEPTQPILAEHSIGRGDQHDPHAEFESLVEQAATA